MLLFGFVLIHGLKLATAVSAHTQTLEFADEAPHAEDVIPR